MINKLMVLVDLYTCQYDLTFYGNILKIYNKLIILIKKKVPLYRSYRNKYFLVILFSVSVNLYSLLIFPYNKQKFWDMKSILMLTLSLPLYNWYINIFYS